MIAIRSFLSATQYERRAWNLHSVQAENARTAGEVAVERSHWRPGMYSAL